MKARVKPAAQAGRIHQCLVSRTRYAQVLVIEVPSARWIVLMKEPIGKCIRKKRFLTRGIGKKEIHGSSVLYDPLQFYRATALPWPRIAPPTAQAARPRGEALAIHGGDAQD